MSMIKRFIDPLDIPDLGIIPKGDYPVTVSAVLEEEMETVKLFAIKDENIYYVPAVSYGQAVEKYKEEMLRRLNEDGETEATLGDIGDPEKVTIACDADHLIMPANYDIDS